MNRNAAFRAGTWRTIVAQAVIGFRPDTPNVDRWNSERVLFPLVMLSVNAMWIALAVFIIGSLYVALIGVFLLVAHLAYVTHLRGNGGPRDPTRCPSCATASKRSRIGRV